MIDPQELANRIGATQRATEEALNSGDAASALTHALAQHENLREGFAYLRDVQGLDLDWGQVAGTGGSAARGGGAKDAPAQIEG